MAEAKDGTGQAVGTAPVERPGGVSHKEFVAALDSDSRKTPVRVAFVTRRTSPQVKARDDQTVMTFPEGLFRGLVAVEVLALALVVLAMAWNAPLEEFADPLQTPNPAKAPWYFLGLQELLHFFPPFVAGILIPTLVVIAFIVIPFFNVNVEGRAIWAHRPAQHLRIILPVIAVLLAFLAFFHAWTIFAPTALVAVLLVFSYSGRQADQGWLKALGTKPLSWWIMTWFIAVSICLTVVGTFFRGPGWSWVWPWRTHAG